MMQQDDPHAGSAVVSAGPAPEEAAATLVLLHGRGGTAREMLSLLPELKVPDLAVLAPQATGSTWYPYSFLQTMSLNQPYLDSALRRVESLVSELIGRGVATERIALLGFSQGACLACEFAARHPRRYGALMGLSGGLIGPPGTSRNYPGSLDGMPLFLGCGDPDAHIPFERVEETAAVLTRMNAATDMRRYPGMGHTISADEIDACSTLLQRIALPPA